MTRQIMLKVAFLAFLYWQPCPSQQQIMQINRRSGSAKLYQTHSQLCFAGNYARKWKANLHIVKVETALPHNSLIKRLRQTAHTTTVTFKAIKLICATMLTLTQSYTSPPKHVMKPPCKQCHPTPPLCVHLDMV